MRHALAGNAQTESAFAQRLGEGTSEERLHFDSGSSFSAWAQRLTKWPTISMRLIAGKNSSSMGIAHDFKIPLARLRFTGWK